MHYTMFIYISTFTLLQHADIESNSRPKNKQINNLSCCHWNVNSLQDQNLFKTSQIEIHNSFYSHDFICIWESHLDSKILEWDRSFHLSG